MQRLADDIAWHREQIRLARLALKEADQAANPTRAIEVEAITNSLDRLERTLAHLEELHQKRA